MFKWRIGVYCGRRLRRGDWLKKSISATKCCNRAQVQRSAQRAFTSARSCQMSGVVPRHRPGRAGDLMLRNFEVYDIADNQLTDAVSLGQVGWAVRRLSPNGLQRLHRQLGRSAQLSARESCTRWPASATIRPMPRLSSAHGADNVTTDVPDTP